MSQLAIGIDIGGTNTKIGLVSDLGKILDFTKFSTLEAKTFDAFVLQIKQTTDRLLQSQHRSYDDVVAIGVGAPNGNFHNGKIESPTNLKHWGTVELIKKFKEVFPIPVYLDNDANVAASGEGQWGVAQKMYDYIVVTLGTGIGTGVVCNGRLVRGHNGMATEGGHMAIIPLGRECSCGGHGHLEMYGSVRGIKLTTKEITGKDMSFAEIFEANQKNDPLIKLAIEQTAKYLAQGLAQMGSLLAPQAIILAGGVASLGEELVTLVQKEYDQLIYPPFRGDTKILLSSISTSEGAVVGAAGLALKHHLTTC